MSQNPLNADQQAAADGFFSFLFSKTPELNISGPGGVGKTYLMGYLIDEILPRYHQTCAMMGITAEYDTVVMTATTNKAADVLGKATGRPAQTIQSFMNLKVMDDFKTGKSSLIKTRSWKVHQKMIIFVDEASMVDNSLLTMIREGTQNCKIIFVGDHCQLAPIMEPLSPIYRQGLPFFELLEPMRTGVFELQRINYQLRQTVETGEFLPIQIVPGIIDYLDSSQMEQEISKYFSTDTNSRILSYTNSRVVAYNDYIRDLRQMHDTYTLGEKLINNNAIQIPDGMLSVEQEVTIERIGDIEGVFLEPEVELLVRYCDLKNNFGEIIEDIPLPEDRGHFTALIKYYQKQKNWSKYFHLKNTFPDLRPRDAATVHKAQGSTYDTVFVDLGNLSSCHNPNQAARLLYVAFSRAQNRIVLYGELAEKYGGLAF